MSILIENVYVDFPGGTTLVIKNSTVSAGDKRDMSSILGLGRSPGEGNGDTLSYGLENPMDRGASWATVHSVAKSRTRLK